jgi:hypothetical protein
MVKNLFTVLALFCCCVHNYSQSNLSHELLNLGLENVRVFSKNQIRYIGYENNRYRFEGDALFEVIKSIVKEEYNIQDTYILIYNIGLPVVYVRVPKSTLQDIKAENFSKQSIDEIYASLDINFLDAIYKSHNPQNSSFFKFDLQLGFHLDYQLGNFDNGVKEKLYARPNLKPVLGHGTQINLSHQMVVINDYNNQNYSRPYMAVLSQDYKLPYNGFINASLGFFEFNRFGYNISFSKLLNEEMFYVEINYGMSRYSYLDDNVVPIYSSNQQAFYNGAINYRWRKHDVDVKFNYGTFLQNDLGYHFSISRQFEDKFIHLFYKKTNLGDVGGFGFIATLPQRKFLKPTKIRARLADDVALNYNYFGNNIARSYFTGPSLFNDIQEYYPSILLKAIHSRLID